MAERLTIKDLSLQYSASEPKVLSSFTFQVEPGSCCAVIGPTGAGKSSLLHCLAGTMRKHHPESLASGRIEIGRSHFEQLPDHILFPDVGLVLQDPYVQISGVRETVFDEILLTLENLGAAPADPRKAITSLLETLGIGHLAERKPTTLSGGETQRVALAAILIAHPPLLLLDEPTTALDSNAQEKLRDFLRSLRGSTTIVFTDTHIDFALAVADQILLLDQGTTIFQGEPKDLLLRLNEFTATIPIEGWLKVRSFFQSPEQTFAHSRQVIKVLGRR